MLRHYDDLGILKPARIDTATGYRYYLADQLPRLNRIVVLKDLGFSLEQIAKLLLDELSSESLSGMLTLKRAEVEARIQAEQERLTLLDAHLRHIKEQAELPIYDVVLRDVPGGIYATMRKVVTDIDTTVQFMFEEVEKYVAHYGVRASAPPMMRYHDADFQEENTDIEVAIPVSGAIPGSDTIQIQAIEGNQTMACLVYTGAYDQTTEALRALLMWVEQHRYEIDGPLREVYLRFGADEVGYRIPDVYLTEQNAEFVTELQIPVRKS